MKFSTLAGTLHPLMPAECETPATDLCLLVMEMESSPK